MQAYITTKKELQEAVNTAVNDLFQKELPQIIRRANRKEWLTVDELMELTGWARRTIYYLKSEDKIPYSQEKHRILFPTDGIEEYLRNHMVNPLED